uniref:Putative ovule protein n=1 Tax=Solanum chacoense TaxID=4108 RepID=A0A0V0H5V9_SOLCH
MKNKMSTKAARLGPVRSFKSKTHLTFHIPQLMTIITSHFSSTMIYFCNDVNGGERLSIYNPDVFLLPALGEMNSQLNRKLKKVGWLLNNFCWDCYSYWETI